MAEERRNQRPSRDGARQSSPAGSGGRSQSAGRGGGRSGDGRPEGGRGRGGARPDSARAERSTRGGHDGRDEPRVRRSAEDQAIYDGPELPVDVTGHELDKAILAQLKSLPEKLANRVARHLVAAGMLIDEDPEIAFQHARAARVRAPRIAIVREAAGESAYAAGHYSEALSDLRAAKRMNGATAYLPIMADCHRALKQPEQALKLSKSPSVASFPPEAKAEMTIVEAGARRDMGQMDAALRTLELAPLNSKARESWVVRLRYAYADTLAEAGRLQDAVEWFHRANAVDGDQITDAGDRAESLAKQLDRP